MHVRELVDVAALVALNGPALVEGTRAPNTAHLQQYWASSRLRAENWCRVLKRASCLPKGPSREGLSLWIEVRSALDEVFTSEMLTRVWTAVLVAHDRKCGGQTAEPIARSVLQAHMEARCRALELLVFPGGVTTHQAVAVNRLRRRIERWTDVLLGGVWHIGGVGEFAHEPERADDFAVDLARRRDQPGGAQAWQLTLTSLRSAFQRGLSPLPANPEANARITAGILGCFPADLFDSTGLFRSLWMVRMAATACDAQCLIDDLLEPGHPPLVSAVSARRTRRN